MTDNFALEPLSRAKQAIAEVETIPEAKQLLDKFSSLHSYARRQQMDLETINEIAEARIWTRRKIGELLKVMPKNKGTAGAGNANIGRGTGGSRLELPVDKAPTLDDLGISKAESSRMQAESAILEIIVREYFEEMKEAEEEITSAGLRRAAKKLVSDKSSYDGDEWHTPDVYIKAAREVMGEIDLDPATNPTAQELIQAKRYFTKEDNGLLQEWRGCVWLNPPYSMPKIAHFVDKLVSEFDQAHVTEAIILVNNSSDTKWFHKLIDRFPACFTKGRIQFWHPDHAGFATRQGQTFFYLGPPQKKKTFQDIFSDFGAVVEKI